MTNQMSKKDRKLMNEVCNPNPNVRLAKMFIAVGAMLIAVSLLCSCGLQDQVNELRKKSNQAENRNAALTSRINALDTQLQLNISSLFNQISVLSNSVSNDSGLSPEQVESINNQITALSLQTQEITVQLASVQGFSGIIGIKDPCGAQHGLNQVLLHLSDGRYLSSYSDNETGRNTRFVILLDGTYRTTDGTHCVYDVTNYGTVITNERIY